MQLTDEELSILHGDKGDLLRKFMAVLVGIGDCFDAPRLIPVNSVHVPSVTITTLGSGGRTLLSQIRNEGLRCQAYTTVNPMAMELCNPCSLPITQDEYAAQCDVADNVREIGASPCYTCTPYSIGNCPGFRENAAWGEVSAVIYVNSVLGARTNPEGAPSAWASALLGKTPLYGLHLDENRYGQFIVRVTTPLQSQAEYGALTLFGGSTHPDLIPVFTGLPRTIDWDCLKTMSAGLYLRNLSRIFHAVGITPEAATIEQALGNKKPLDVIDFGNKELENTMAMLNTEASRDVSWVVIGCPHCSLAELSEIAQYMDGKKVNHNVDLWILTSHAVKTMAERMGVIAAIEKSGGRILTDTCPDVITGKTLRALGHSSITTTSTVFAHSLGEYAAPHLFDNHVHHGSMKRCLDAAVSGTWRENG